jgi:hypothetical protein
MAVILVDVASKPAKQAKGDGRYIRDIRDTRDAESCLLIMHDKSDYRNCNIKMVGSQLLKAINVLLITQK